MRCEAIRSNATSSPSSLTLVALCSSWSCGLSAGLVDFIVCSGSVRFSSISATWLGLGPRHGALKAKQTIQIFITKTNPQSFIMCEHLLLLQVATQFRLPLLLLLLLSTVFGLPPGRESAKQIRYPAGVDFFEHEFSSLLPGAFNHVDRWPKSALYIGITFLQTSTIRMGRK